LHFPEYIPALHAKYMQHYTPKFIEKAKKIITVSEFSKQDLMQHYAVAAKKIEVVYNAAPQPPKGDFTVVHENILSIDYKIDTPYFIFVGAIHPRKNVLNLVCAFEIFKQKKSSNFKLVLVGRDAWLNNELKIKLQNSTFKNDIIWIKNMDRTNLLSLMENAFALTYLCHFEGFGIPLVEAMASDIPIIASNTSAIPEIAGNAALYCPPDDIEQIALQMTALSENKILYQTLKINALERKKLFNWDKSALKVAEIIPSVLYNVFPKH
jgi:glycosyltransferase involved in cell wall biosynthesis